MAATFPDSEREDERNIRNIRIRQRRTASPPSFLQRRSGSRIRDSEREYERNIRNICNRLKNSKTKFDDLITKGLLPILITAAPAYFLQRSFDGSVLETNPILGLAVLFVVLGSVLACISFIWNLMWILDSSSTLWLEDWDESQCQSQTQGDGKVELHLLIRAVQLLETFIWRYLKVVLIMTSSLLCFLAGYICLGLPITKSLWYHHKVIVIILLLALLSLVVSIAMLLSGVSNECFTDEMWCRALKCKLQTKLNQMNGAVVQLIREATDK